MVAANGLPTVMVHTVSEGSEDGHGDASAGVGDASVPATPPAMIANPLFPVVAPGQQVSVHAVLEHQRGRSGQQGSMRSQPSMQR
jgi:hypothetical protein